MTYLPSLVPFVRFAGAIALAFGIGASAGTRPRCGRRAALLGE